MALRHSLFEVDIGKQFTRPYVRTAHRFLLLLLNSTGIRFALQCQSSDPVFFSSLLGVGLAILALLLGASAYRIAERKWLNVVKNVRGSAATAERAEVTAVLAKAEKTNAMTTIVLGLALLCVVLSRAVT